MKNDELQYMDSTNTLKYWTTRAVEYGARLDDTEKENEALRTDLRTAKKEIARLDALSKDLDSIGVALCRTVAECCGVKVEKIISSAKEKLKKLADRRES